MKDSNEELNSLLFEQLRTMKSAPKEVLSMEAERSKSMVALAQTIVENAKVSLAGRKYLSDTGDFYANLPNYLQIEDDGKIVNPPSSSQPRKGPHSSHRAMPYIKQGKKHEAK